MAQSLESGKVTGAQRLAPKLIPDLILLRPWIQALLDLMCIAFTAHICAYVLTDLRSGAGVWPLRPNYQTLVILSCALAPWVFHRFGLYRTEHGQHLTPELVQLFSAWLIVALLLSAIGVLTKTNIFVSRVWVISWASSAFFAMALCRALVSWLYAHIAASGYNTKNVVIIGSGSLAAHVIQKIINTPHSGLNVLGYFRDDEKDLSRTITANCLGMLETLESYVLNAEQRPDEIWFALPTRKTHLLEKFSELITQSTIDVRIVPDTMDYALLNHTIEDVAGLSVISLNQAPTQGLNRFLKAVEDRVLSALILLFIAPLMLLIAIAIKLTSPGPIIFRQMRHGWKGEEIVIYKFRTMKVHQEAGDQITLATPEDPRVTKFGRMLRSTSMDEFPQFINVLQGRLSIVGPRAQAVAINNKFSALVNGYMLRHKVKPGITGWAQVNGFRGDMSNLDAVRQRIEHDLYYINHWSVWFDIAIIVLTVLRGFNSPKAY